MKSISFDNRPAAAGSASCFQLCQGMAEILLTENGLQAWNVSCSLSKAYQGNETVTNPSKMNGEMAST